MNYDIETKEGLANSVAWTERLFTLMSEGAVWSIPRSVTIVRVYPSKKEVVIIDGVAPEKSLARVIEAMGWTIVSQPTGEKS
jgi:hypothetical protein